MVREQIQSRGITDPRVLDALSAVPRERFVAEAVRPRAYSDHALGIAHGQTISQPYMVASMTAALELEPTDRVLEIGTGSGYQCAVLSRLAAEVWSVERIPELADDARALLLDELECDNVHIRAGDGTLGWPEQAPFDAILVTAAAPAVPPPLLRQLDPAGGRLVAPIGDRYLQRVQIVHRTGTEYVMEEATACRFVPLLGAAGWPTE